MDPASGRARGRAREPTGRGQTLPAVGHGGPPAGLIRPQAPQVGGAEGRAAMPRGEAAAAGHGAGGDILRGAIRGRRIINDIVISRPAHVQSKKGTAGQQVQLTANYFKILKKPDWALFQYRVDFAPDIEVTGIRKALLFQHKQLLGGHLFDGTMLFIPHKLPSDVTEIVSTRRDETIIKITIKYVAEVSATDQNSLQVLNLILRRAMEGLKLQLVGRNLFDAKATVAITEYKLELWPGYITSIRQHENDVLLCSEITSKVMRQQTLLDILSECSRSSRDFKETFTRMVIGTTVLTDYNNKTYRIDDIDWDQSPSSTFDTKDGAISYVNYYKTRYNITIRDARQPLLLSKSKERQRRGGQSELIALIPELCRATGLTDDMRANFRLMQAVAQYTRIGPGERIQRLQRFNQRLQNTPESMQVLKDWNMKLDQQLVTFNGRQLPQEAIVFQGREAPGKVEADWTRELTQSRMYTAINLTNWFVVSAQRCGKEARDFAQSLAQAVKNMGMQIGQPQFVDIPDDRGDSYIRALDSITNQDPQLIMVVVTNNKSDRYQIVKKKCCIDRAIPTQVMVHKTITPRGGNTRGLLSVATKVAIQMNCKLGAAPWFIKLPLTGLMTVGFDVSHDTKDKSKSYGALVATMDLRSSCKYFSAVSAHQNGEELSNELCLNMQKALREYHKEHGALPSKILFYRDGVGEGQTHYVFEHEVENLKRALAKVYEMAGSAEKPRLTFIIVSKKINTRLFKGAQNPQPGTVVDDVITMPERYDFYLISQLVRQGTVSPTNYNVLFDELGLPPDKLQLLSYKMCHLYYNWSGTTRVPAVCQYAHKLSFLVAQHLHQSPSNLLDKRLYFL